MLRKRSFLDMEVGESSAERESDPGTDFVCYGGQEEGLSSL